MQRFLYNLVTNKYKGPIAGLIKVLLFILSCIYGLLVRFLIFLSHLKPYRLNCKVISVGNITLGGTGKTSLVEYIAHYLKQQGRKVAILSRGYKRKITQYVIPNTSACRYFGIHNTQYETMGDEPYMLSKNLNDIPVIVDANRIKGAARAINDYGADTVILDDGFQQWKIKKDLEVVTIDATNPFGNRYLIPRGILREPPSSLKRADTFVLTKTNLNPDVADIRYFLNRINPGAVVFEAIHKPVGFYQVDNPDKWLNTEMLKSKSVILFSGIADPDSFENLITNLDINIGMHFRFSDHYDYSQKDLDKIVQASKEKNIDTIITTEKDAARLYDIRHTTYDMRLLALCIKLEIKNEQEFHNRLLRQYSV